MSPPPEEDDEYLQTQMILLAASHHDLESLRTLLRSTPASVQDPESGYSPLHAAIAAAGGDGQHPQNGADLSLGSVDRAAEKTLSLLLQNGAIWNALDENNETPGCLARRLDLHSLYDMMVDAGVRAELLLNRMDEYEPLPGEEEEGKDIESRASSDEVRAAHDQGAAPAQEPPSQGEQNTTVHMLNPRETPAGHATGASDYDVTNNDDYLASDIRIQNDKIVDVEDNGVMMAWERTIMERTAEILLPEKGLSVLNVGHGMGIVDDFFQQHSPMAHHIVEAHPNVLEKMREKGWTQRQNVTVHAGKWQDELPKLAQQGITFDAIFFDTFAESYSAFRYLFSELFIALLKPEGVFSFFHGLGADRQISYDVYTKVVEMDLFEAGFDTTWECFDSQEDASAWTNVRRRYWTLEKYKLPKCTFIA